MSGQIRVVIAAVVMSVVMSVFLAAVRSAVRYLRWRRVRGRSHAGWQTALADIDEYYPDDEDSRVLILSGNYQANGEFFTVDTEYGFDHRADASRFDQYLQGGGKLLIRFNPEQPSEYEIDPTGFHN